ncbi:MAG: imidazolonepropionase [Phycisphaerae bacterium]|nr:imidazolonepropionase [Phycisphaerae bacterium]
MTTRSTSLTARTAITGARILTLASGKQDRAPRREGSLADLGTLDRGWLLVEEGRISRIGAGDAPHFDPETRIVHADGRVVMPAFVDCHTHACFAGDRANEFEARLAGAGYLEILAAGGGIMATVRAVRDAEETLLAEALLGRLERMARLGTGTVEVKSGYGLDPATELKMLRATRLAAERSPQIVVPTFLGAHALDADAEDPDGAVNAIINEALPEAAAAFPGILCDAYCEEGAWSLADCRRLFESAQSLGCPIRVHTDQFNRLGMTRLAVEMGARSVDHLEATSAEDLQRIAASDTIGVLLPTSGFSLDDRYADGRGLIDRGGAVAIASNYNPGSAPSPSVALAIALACRKCGLRPAEAITAATWNAACVLDLQDEVGSLEPGKRADLLLLDTRDERDLGLEIAGPGPVGVMLAGAWHDFHWQG